MFASHRGIYPLFTLAALRVRRGSDNRVQITTCSKKAGDGRQTYPLCFLQAGSMQWI